MIRTTTFFKIFAVVINIVNYNEFQSFKINKEDLKENNSSNTDINKIDFSSLKGIFEDFPKTDSSIYLARINQDQNLIRNSVIKNVDSKISNIDAVQDDDFSNKIYQKEISSENNDKTVNEDGKLNKSDSEILVETSEGVINQENNFLSETISHKSEEVEFGGDNKFIKDDKNQQDNINDKKIEEIDNNINILSKEVLKDENQTLFSDNEKKKDIQKNDENHNQETSENNLQNIKKKEDPFDEKLENLEKTKKELENQEGDKEKILFIEKAPENSICGINYKNSIRINEKTIYKKNAIYDDLILSLKLDSEKIDFDYSGNNNHAYYVQKKYNEKTHHFNFFKGDSYYFIKDVVALSSFPLSISFGFNYTKKIIDSDFNCPIILKGDDDLINKIYNRMPGIYLSEKTGQIIISISTTSHSTITLTSMAYLLPNTLHVISLVISEEKISLYINGILDTVKEFDMIKVEINNYDLYVGNHPEYLFSCRVSFEIKEFKIFAKELNFGVLQNLAFGSFGNFIEPAYIMLGCFNCDIQTGRESCPDKFHFCLNTEFFSGVYFAAKKMGWDFLSDSKEFIYDSTSSEFKTIGTGICCKDY